MLVAGYLNKRLVEKINSLGIKCIIHYNLIPDIYGEKIEFQNHLQEVKRTTKYHLNKRDVK